MISLYPRSAGATPVHPLIQDGTFGAPEGIKLPDSTVVSRGDYQSRVFRDPASQNSGLILSGMAYQKISQSCPAPEFRFQVALDAAQEVHEYWKGLSDEDKVSYITQHVIASSTFASPLLSLSLNEAVGGYFALGARNASTQVYRGLVSNRNLYASGQPGFEVPDASFDHASANMINGEFSFENKVGHHTPVERWLTIAGNHSIPLSEFLSVGGFYFRDSVEPVLAVRQNPSTFRTPDELSHLKNISQVQRKLSTPAEPTYLDFSSEFAESITHHTNQTVQQLGLLDPDSFDYYPDHN